MTSTEIAQSLPHGFHDAECQRLKMNYVDRALQFDLVVWVGDMGDTKGRERYRPALVTVHDVAYLVLEPPDPKYPWCTPGSMRVDAGEGQPRRSEGVLPAAPVGTSLTWMYMEGLNRFLLFAAGSASLEWTGPEENRSR